MCLFCKVSVHACLWCLHIWALLSLLKVTFPPAPSSHDVIRLRVSVTTKGGSSPLFSTWTQSKHHQYVVLIGSLSHGEGIVSGFDCAAALWLSLQVTSYEWTLDECWQKTQPGDHQREWVTVWLCPGRTRGGDEDDKKKTQCRVFLFFFSKLPRIQTITYRLQHRFCLQRHQRTAGKWINRSSLDDMCSGLHSRCHLLDVIKLAYHEHFNNNGSFSQRLWTPGNARAGRWAHLHMWKWGFGRLEVGHGLNSCVRWLKISKTTWVNVAHVTRICICCIYTQLHLDVSSTTMLIIASNKDLPCSCEEDRLALIYNALLLLFHYKQSSCRLYIHYQQSQIFNLCGIILESLVLGSIKLITDRNNRYPRITHIYFLIFHLIEMNKDTLRPSVNLCSYWATINDHRHVVEHALLL